MSNFVNKNKRMMVVVLGGLILITIGITIYIFMHLYAERAAPAPILTPPPTEKPQEELMDEQSFLQDLHEMMAQGKAVEEGAVPIKIENGQFFATSITIGLDQPILFYTFDLEAAYQILFNQKVVGTVGMIGLGARQTDASASFGFDLVRLDMPAGRYQLFLNQINEEQALPGNFPSLLVIIE